MQPAYHMLITGAGLAGSILAYKMKLAGQTPLLISDPSIPSASRTAAGLINPITGQRLVLQDQIQPLLESASHFYQDIESRFNIKVFHKKKMLRVFRSEKEKTAWKKRKDDPAYLPYFDASASDTYKTDHGNTGVIQQQTGYLDTNTLLDTLHQWFKEQDILLEATLDYRDVKIKTDAVLWKGVQAEKIIFCEGWRGQNNPWFQWLPFQPAKGEILTLSIDDELPDHIVNQGKWLLPIHANRFKLGATYEWHTLNEIPTEGAKQELLSAMKTLISRKHSAKVISHLAGVRPGTKDKQPFIGLHPEHKQLGIFNGFGSKGSLMIPWHADQLIQHLTSRCKLPANVDVRRWCQAVNVKHGSRLSITDEVHHFLSSHIAEGDVVVDATLGNGHDALFLARLIGDKGHLFGFDIQAKAIKNTLNKLASRQLSSRASILMKGHENMASLIPERLHGHVRCIVFNLGYLPGSDKSLTTRVDSTLAALNQGCGLLSRGGHISILAYTGHPGGYAECKAVKLWASRLNSETFSVKDQNMLPDHKNPPEWILITKIK